MSDPILPIDLPEQRERKNGDYVLDISMERGPNMSIRMSKLQAETAYDAIRKARLEGELDLVEFEHDCGLTSVDPGAVVVMTIRVWEDPVEMLMSHEGAPVIGMIGPRGPKH